MTFEEIDKMISDFNLSDYQPGGKFSRAEGISAESATDIISKLCPIYKIIRPILNILSKLPILKTSWRDAINTFIGFMDTFCP